MATSAPFRAPLAAAFHRALTYLDALDISSVAATADLATLRQRLARSLEAEGLPPEQVISDLVADVDGGLLGSAGGRFFGWVVGGSLPAALAADWLTAVWDQNAALYACAPAAAVVEEVTGGWLKDVLTLPRSASFALVSGCQMAHVTALAAARHALLSERGWDVEERGLYGAPAIRILSNDQRHGSIERAIRLLGFGRSHVEDLASDAQGRLGEAALAHALAASPGVPTILLLQAGDLNIGAYDDFEALIPLAKRHSVWVHVDGAFGLWAGASARHRHHVAGIDQADSWATDGHKWLNVPYDCGYVFVANAEAHRASMSHRAPYLTHDAKARDQMDWNPEWSRRARGFATYAALRQLGRDGLEQLVDRSCEHARVLVTRLGALPGAELLWEPTLNQGLVRFVDPATGASEEDHDRRTDAVIAGVLTTGEAFFGGTTWRGRRAMRVSVCGWQTTVEDVDRSVRAVASVLEAMTL
ncbi:MAG: pyridoxal-dependent decarboxylase [Thermoanaerobaculia bacterium]